jgi:hypothetical protein
MPYLPCPGGGCASGQTFDSLTEVSTHELCEAITDPIDYPSFTAWFDDHGNGEIGDICNFRATRLGGYNVQREWSNRYNACRIAPAPLGRFDGLELTGYVWPDGSQQDLFYLSPADGHVHWLWWLPTTGWRYGGDLTEVIGAPDASADSALSSYVWPDGNARYVFYLNAAGHVRALLWNPAFGWSDTGDLTAQAGTPSARSSVLGSYVWPDSGSQHVFYWGDDSRVYELWWLPNPIHASTLAVGLDIQVQPCPPPLNRAVSVMVSAKDEATGLPVDGEVIHRLSHRRPAHNREDE